MQWLFRYNTLLQHMRTLAYHGTAPLLLMLLLLMLLLQAMR
jgi:hypothetical protein